MILKSCTRYDKIMRKIKLQPVVLPEATPPISREGVHRRGIGGARPLGALPCLPVF
jgi:hypothetical protein